MGTKQIKFGVFIISVLFSLYYTFRYGAGDIVVNLAKAAVILGIGGYYAIANNNDSSFYAVKDIFIMLWTVLYLVLPIQGLPNAKNFDTVLNRILNAFSGSDSALIIYAVVFLVLLVVFGKKWKGSLVYKAGLYISSSLFISGLYRIAFQIDTLFVFLTALFALLFDILGKRLYRKESWFKLLLILYSALFVLLTLYPDKELYKRVHNLFYLEEIWPRVAGILLALGAICIAENYISLQDLQEGKMSESFIMGCAFISLAVYVFVGKGWPQYYNLLIVYSAVPIIVYTAFSLGRFMTNSRKVFIYWACVLLFLPAAGRTFNENIRYYLVILVLFTVHHLLTIITWKCGNEVIMQDFWGIAAAILLFTARNNVFDKGVIRSLVPSFIVLIGSCVLWVKLSHDSHVFNKQLTEGKYKKNNYEKTLMIQKIAPRMVMAIALFSLLT